MPISVAVFILVAAAILGIMSGLNGRKKKKEGKVNDGSTPTINEKQVEIPSDKNNAVDKPTKRRLFF